MQHFASSLVTLFTFVACNEASREVASPPAAVPTVPALPAVVASVHESTPPPSAVVEPGRFGIDCRASDTAPIARGSLRLPPRWIVEHAELDAIVHQGDVHRVSEDWKLDAKGGCEHQYRILFSGSAKAPLRELAQKLGVTPSIDGMRFRIHAEELREGVPFFVMVEPGFGGEIVDIRIVHHDADPGICLPRSLESLPPALRVTSELEPLGARVEYTSIVWDEGDRAWCQVKHEWFHDDKKVIFGKIHSWIAQRHPFDAGDKGGKANQLRRFAWDDGGHGYLLRGSANFTSSRSP